MPKILSGAIIAAAVMLAYSGLVQSQQNAGQTGSTTNQATDPDAIACNTSSPNRRGAFLTVEGIDGVNGSPCHFEIKDFSFGVENPTTIGSATGGAGAGKVKFNEFTIKRTSDSASPAFYRHCTAGAHYPTVTLRVRKAGGGPAGAGRPFLTYRFETVFATKMDWSGPGDEGPEETITFVYGELAVEYHPQ